MKRENNHRKNHPHLGKKFNYIKFWCDLNIIIRIECILLKFHWGMKALIELHFQYEASIHSNNGLSNT
jgi:hypothetical protein